jgi:hypothetical protein
VHHRERVVSWLANVCGSGAASGTNPVGLAGELLKKTTFTSDGGVNFLSCIRYRYDSGYRYRKVFIFLERHNSRILRPNFCWFIQGFRRLESKDRVSSNIRQSRRGLFWHATNAKKVLAEGYLYRQASNFHAAFGNPACLILGMLLKVPKLGTLQASQSIPHETKTQRRRVLAGCRLPRCGK